MPSRTLKLCLLTKPKATIFSFVLRTKRFDSYSAQIPFQGIRRLRKRQVRDASGGHRVRSFTLLFSAFTAPAHALERLQKCNQGLLVSG